MNLPSELITRVVSFCDVQTCLNLRLVCHVLNYYAMPHAMTSLSLTIDFNEYLDGQISPYCAVMYAGITKAFRLTIFQTESTQGTMWSLSWHRFIDIRRWTSPRAMKAVIEPYKGLFEGLVKLDVSFLIGDITSSYNYVKNEIPGHLQEERPNLVPAIHSATELRILFIMVDSSNRPENLQAILPPSPFTWPKLQVLKLKSLTMHEYDLLDFLEAHAGSLEDLTLHHANIIGRDSRQYDCAPSINELTKRVSLERLEVHVYFDWLAGEAGLRVRTTIQRIRELSWGKCETNFGSDSQGEMEFVVVRETLKESTPSEVTDSPLHAGNVR